jgi:tRNA dimethylallyltransferase
MMTSWENGMDAILITGPTASGKSALAVELAQKHDGEVVNADSMQVYDTLHVLTARPFDADMGGIPHHLYGSVPAGAKYSTGKWLRSVAEILAGIRARGRVPVFVGGTGLYFKALTGGLSDMPEIPEAIRQKWRDRFAEEGGAFLHAALKAIDPVAGETLKPTDGQRVLRALEVMEASGRSILDFQAEAGSAVIDPERAMKLIVEPDRAILHDRINRRFEKMLDMGAVGETKALLALGLDPAMPVMKAIGVPQIRAMLAGEMSRQEVIEKASAATRQYAKRQLTWFRNQMDDSWKRV